MIKKILLSLFWIITLWLTSFWYCDYVWDYLSDLILFSWSSTFPWVSYANVFNYWDNWEWTYCISLTWDLPWDLTYWFANWWTATPSNTYKLYSNQAWEWICLFWNKSYFNLRINQSNSATIYYQVFKLSDLLNFEIDASELEECQSDLSNLQSSYNSLNSSYNSCLTDYWSCSSSLNYCYYDLWNCRAWVCSWDISTNLFINNIQYPLSTNLFVNVPLEFDYVYTMTWNESTIDIEYKVDSEYISWIITTQNSKPSKSDLNYIISSLLPLFVPWLVIILFIYFVFKFIKKVF